MPETASPLKARITEDMKTAMRSGEKARLATIRLVLAAIKQVEVDTRSALTDDDLLPLLDRMCKQRRESIEQFEQAGRDDLASKERQELEIIQTYLPAQLSEAEIARLIDEAIAKTGAESVRDMGKVIRSAVAEVPAKGRDTMGVVFARFADDDRVISVARNVERNLRSDSAAELADDGAGSTADDSDENEKDDIE